MDKLIKRKDEFVYLAIAEKLPKAKQEIESSKEVLEGLYATWQKLADYEDIGLTPEEIKSFLSDFGITVTMRNRKLIEELQEYRSLEAEERLIKLPCKVGNIVYFIKSAFSMASFPIDAKVVSIRGISTLGEIMYSSITNYNKIDRHFTSEDIGKTVFLTRKEAEEALYGGLK